MTESDRFAGVEFVSSNEVKETKPLSMSDPFGGVEFTSSTGKTDLPFKFPEESFTATALDTIPFAKYVLPEEQDKLDRMSDQEKTFAFSMAALGAGLFLFGGPLLRGVSRGVSSAVRLGGRAISADAGINLASRLAKTAELPVEDVISGISSKTKMYELKPFSYETSLRNTLKSSGFKKEEVDAITNAQLTNTPRAYTDAVINRTYQNKEMSQAWKEAVTPTKEPYGGFELSQNWKNSLSVEKLQGQHYSKEYSNVLEEEVLNTRKFPKDYMQNIYERQVKSIRPDTSGEALKLENITERDFGDFVTDMLSNKREYRTGLSTTGGRLWPASLTPTRIIYGLNEDAWKAKSGFYDPLKTVWEDSKQYTFDWARTWAEMLHQRGLAKLKFDNYGGFSLADMKFGKVETDQAFKVLREIDSLTASKGDLNVINQKVINLLGDVDPGSATGKLIDTWRDFSDTLYGDYMNRKLPQILRSGGNLSIFGQNGVDATMAKYIPKIANTFSSSGSRPTVQKILEMRSYLDDIKGLLEPIEANGKLSHPWFSLEDKELKTHVNGLLDSLTLRNDGGKLTGYTDNYIARISDDQNRLWAKWSAALTNRKGAFEQPRISIEPVGTPVDFNTMIASRVQSQANALILYPKVDELVNVAKNYPVNLSSYVEHHLARLLNTPSSVDYTVSRVFENSIGKIEGLFGKEGTWSPRRVMNLSQTVNDMVYLGALGFKPFSAARNLFQPLITGAPDIGEGGYAALLKGYTRLINPSTKQATREYLNNIGVISEYLPELNIKPSFLPFSKSNILGKEIDTTRIESFKDAAMWMFKASDRFNKYVTGSAAMTKWEGGISKFSDGSINPANVDKVLKLTGASNRNPWVRTEIEGLLRKGLVDDAKAVYVKDVVADSQFLYGALDAPQIIGKYGSLSRTGLAFQSYWMNLAPLIEKSLRTGTLEDKVRRPLMGMLSSAAAYMMMEPIWGGPSAKQSVGVGPFPTEINEYMVPAAWSPIYRALRVAAAGMELNPDMAGKQAKKLLGSTLIFVPGGLQAKKMFKGYQDEGFTGFAKSIIGMPKAE